jgi:hypothetical protein
MGDENRIERFRVALSRAEALEGFLAGEAGVDKEASPPGGNQGRVSSARRRENRELDDGMLLTLQYTRRGLHRVCDAASPGLHRMRDAAKSPP